jgi:hypothetical protein
VALDRPAPASRYRVTPDAIDARVLGERVEDGLMGMSEAISIAQNWLYAVPTALYRL